MASKPARPSSEAPLYRFAFTKLQIGMLAAGLAVLVALSFSLGFVVAERETLQRARQRGSETAGLQPGLAGKQPSPRKTTVRLVPPEGEEGEGGGAPAIEAEFYKELLARKPREARGLEPIQLPGGADVTTRPTPPRRGRKADLPDQRASRAGGSPGGGEAERPARGYTIQVLSVREPERAARAVRALRRRGVPAFIERADLKEKGVWHRVRVGRYPDHATASRALEELRAKTFLRGGKVVPP